MLMHINLSSKVEVNVEAVPCIPPSICVYA